eukprot:s806_g10.t1
MTVVAAVPYRPLWQERNRHQDWSGGDELRELRSGTVRQSRVRVTASIWTLYHFVLPQLLNSDVGDACAN